MTSWRDTVLVFGALPEVGALLCRRSGLDLVAATAAAFCGRIPPAAKCLAARRFGGLFATALGTETSAPPGRRQSRPLHAREGNAGAAAACRSLHALPLACRCRRIRASDEERGVLVTALEASGVAPSLSDLAAFLSAPGTDIAILDTAGKTLADIEAWYRLPDFTSDASLEFSAGGQPIRLHLLEHPATSERKVSTLHADDAALAEENIAERSERLPEPAARPTTASQIVLSADTRRAAPERSPDESGAARNPSRRSRRDPSGRIASREATAAVRHGRARGAGTVAQAGALPLADRRRRPLPLRLAGARAGGGPQRRDRRRALAGRRRRGCGSTRRPHRPRARASATPGAASDGLVADRGLERARAGRADGAAGLRRRPFLPGLSRLRRAAAGGGADAGRLRGALRHAGTSPRRPSSCRPTRRRSPRRRANVVPIRADLERIADHMRLTPQERNAFEEIAAALRAAGGRRAASRPQSLAAARDGAAERKRRSTCRLRRPEPTSVESRSSAAWRGHRRIDGPPKSSRSRGCATTPPQPRPRREPLRRDDRDRRSRRRRRAPSALARAARRRRRAAAPARDDGDPRHRDRRRPHPRRATAHRERQRQRRGAVRARRARDAGRRRFGDLLDGREPRARRSTISRA